MKRELAALTTDSPTSENSRRKTRFGNSDGLSQSLVYKRVKKSSSKEIFEVSNEKEENLGVSVVVVEVCKEVEKEICDEEMKDVVEKVENGEKKVEAIVMEVVDGNVCSFEAEVEKERVIEEETMSKTMSKTPLNVGNGSGEEKFGVEGSVEIEKEKVMEETMSKTPLKLGRGKKFGVERYQRRFTRSTLKCNDVVEENVVEEMEKVGKVKEIMVEENEERVKEGKKRVTRSALGKPKEDGGPDSCLTETSDSVVVEKENVENDVSNVDGECGMEKSDSPLRELETKMSKEMAVTKIPKSVRELFETGLLEGCPVYYDSGKGPGLRGRIRAIGICCPCKLCRGCKVIPPSMFEIHATNTYKRAVQYIFLENGRSFIQILKGCKTTRLKTVEETVQNAIGPLPERKVVVCQHCEEPYLTIDVECSDPVCSSCVMSNISPVGPVYSCRKWIGSSKFGVPQGALSCGKLSLEKTSKGKTAKKQAESFFTPMKRSSSRIGRTSETKTSEKSAKDSEEVSLVPKACSSATTSKSVATKKAKKRVENKCRPFKPSKLTRVEKTSKTDDRVKTKKRPRKETLTPKPSKTPSVYGSSEKKTSGKITRKDIRLHKLVFEDDVLPDGTELGYYARGKKLLDGYKKGPGIFCNCCETVVSASQFESHAGCAARRKPYCYIYTSNGVSLHELSVNLIKGRKHSAKFNDDLCSICADGGNLLLCDGCPRAFHTECTSLSGIPRGKWYCKYCENMFEREKFVAHNANAFAAGRVSGVDPMEQITKRSIRIVNNVGTDVSSCILCRGFDFSKSGFGPRTIILCDQCEKEYHVGCLKDHDMADLTELPDGKWFCNSDCGRIDSALQNLLIEGPAKLPGSLLNVITRKNLQNVSESSPDVDVRWRLLSGKIATSETRPLLSQAVAIFHESFAPIVEVVSGHDLIPAMVYGRNVGGQEYGGMYCAVLTVKSVVVSAAIFRVFGPEVAELPLVATSSGNHGKGYFQALFACIERLLTSLKVKTFVLPAAEEAESIWTDRFGFRKMTSEQLRQLKSNFWSMVRFQGTSMLHKPVPECAVVQGPGE